MDANFFFKDKIIHGNNVIFYVLKQLIKLICFNELMLQIDLYLLFYSDYMLVVVSPSYTLQFSSM